MGNYFIAYSREDSKVMEEIRSELKGKGNTVNTDRDIPRNSDDWQKNIEDFIDECDDMVVLLSPSAKNSAPVRREIDYAQLQGKGIISYLVRGDRRNAIPLALSGAQFTDRRNDFRKLYN